MLASLASVMVLLFSVNAELVLVDGQNYSGVGRHATVLEGYGIKMPQGKASVSNLTLQAKPDALPLAQVQFTGGMTGDVDLTFENVDFESIVPFAEIAEGGMVSAIRISDYGAYTLNLTFIDCRFRTQSMILFAGHPRLGSRRTTFNCLFERCSLESNPIGVGPNDPHFLVQDWLPGRLTFRECILRWNMSQSTRADMQRGVILVENEDINSFNGNQQLEVLSSKMEFIDNGLVEVGKPASLVYVVAQPNKKRCQVLLEDVILRRGANVPYSIVTSNQSRIEYSQCNSLLFQSYGYPAEIINLDVGKAELIGVGKIIGNGRVLEIRR